MLVLGVGCERAIPWALHTLHEWDWRMSLWREEVISLGTALGGVVWFQGSRNEPIGVAGIGMGDGSSPLCIK